MGEKWGSQEDGEEEIVRMKGEEGADEKGGGSGSRRRGEGRS